MSDNVMEVSPECIEKVENVLLCELDLSQYIEVFRNKRFYIIASFDIPVEEDAKTFIEFVVTDRCGNYARREFTTLEHALQYGFTILGGDTINRKH